MSAIDCGVVVRHAAKPRRRSESIDTIFVCGGIDFPLPQARCCREGPTLQDLEYKVLDRALGGQESTSGRGQDTQDTRCSGGVMYNSLAQNNL